MDLDAVLMINCLDMLLLSLPFPVTITAILCVEAALYREKVPYLTTDTVSLQDSIMY